ncbi:MAG: hypothetical protein HFI05_13565 [Lachnospiraceae bacterium]|jgi:hypothetical protein|nr:hypothetical protein [Lachnospiraceae bacterium]
MKKAKNFRGIILVILVIALGVTVYTYSLNKGTLTPTEKNSEDEAGKLASRNLETDYPNTPRKVIEYYSQIMKCFYGEELSEEILKKLVQQTRLLYDEELLAQNPEEDALKQTKDYIEEFRENNNKITEYIIEDSKDIEYYTKDDASYAIVTTAYFTRDKSGASKTYEDYLLRKDKDGNWKILGWELTEKASEEE